MSKYWDKTGKYQEQFDQLSDTLMPASGQADSLAGELVRSANRLYYDAFNNGFCNNTSGAIKFVKQYLAPHFKGDAELAAAIKLIEPKTNTGGYSKVCKNTGAALDTIVDRVVEFITANPALKEVPTIDMFDLQDDDYYEEESYDEEYDYK